MKYHGEALAENVHVFEFSCRATDTVPTLIISDVHFDSMKCNRALLKKHLDEIKDAGGLVFIFGDWFDIMATYGDKRSKREDVDPRYIIKGRSYLDVVIEDSIEFLSDYAGNIALIGYGNHETAIHKYHDTDPLRRLVFGLNARYNANVQLGQYSGYIFMRCRYEKSTSRIFTKTIGYHHGKRSNAHRSKGMLNVQIDVMKHPDADILVRGDDHMKWYDPSTTRWRIRQSGRIYKDNVHYLKTGSYKDGLGDGKQGWAVEKDFNPTRLGGWFVDYLFSKNDGIDIRVTEAH